jgi:methyltransferase (TIGR00027 family)
MPQVESELAIRNVSDTAFMVAAWRANESRRTDRLFEDSLAERVAGEEGRHILAALPKKAFLGGWSVVIRTCVIDDLISRAIANGIDTVLNLGAGLDTRPYRMNLPGSLRWVEADLAHVIELKESRLAGEIPRCKLERRKVDLADAASRSMFLEEVASTSKQVLVLTEGVIPYLKPEEVEALARDLRKGPAFSGWIVDYYSPESYEYRRRSKMTATMKNAPFQFEPPDFFGFFRRVGWELEEARYLAEEGVKLGRPVPVSLRLKALMFVVALLSGKERRERMKRFMGYVLMKPGCNDRK